MAQQIVVHPNNAHNVAVAIYATHLEAENAIRELEQSGFDMKT